MDSSTVMRGLGTLLLCAIAAGCATVIYSVEIFDAPSSRPLAAYVTKQYPNAYDIHASVGELTAGTAGIDNGADAFVAQLN